MHLLYITPNKPKNSSHFLQVLLCSDSCKHGPTALSVFLPPSGHDWIMLSSCYVKTDGDVAGWRELLSTLGVRDGLIIRKERVPLTAEDLVRMPHVSPGSRGANGLQPKFREASVFSGCTNSKGRTQDTAVSGIKG